MRNLRLALAFALSPLLVVAQTLATSESKHNFTPTTTNSSTKTPVYETPEQARLLLMSSFNLYRGFSISIEESKEDDNKSIEEKRKWLK